MRERHRLRRQCADRCILRVAYRLYQVACLWGVGNRTYAVRDQRFHLHQRIQGQCCNGDGGQHRNITGEERRVHAVDGIDVADMFEEYSNPHDILQRMVDAFDNRLDILETLFSLRLYTPRHQDTRGGIDRQLSRKIL